VVADAKKHRAKLRRLPVPCPANTPPGASAPDHSPHLAFCCVGLDMVRPLR
jgi:hypothetical protein